MDLLSDNKKYIDNKYNVPEPVLFNCLKHHAGYVSCFIRNYHCNALKNQKRLKKVLNMIGKSQMDLYTGNLTPRQIADEIIRYLKSKNLLEKEEYLSRLSSAGKSYRNLRLSDGSVWVLLPGKTAGRHIHIHPGRYSLFTVRVRSETLKTAIAVLCYCKNYRTDPLEIRVINKVRVKLLDLSSVKEVKWDRGLGKMIRILAGQSISFVIAMAAIVPSATAVVI